MEIEILLFLGELVLELVAGGGLEFLAESRSDKGRPARVTSPVLALGGLLVLGGAVGWIGTLLIPRRLLPPGAVPGLSLILGPLAVGAAMHARGRFRRERGYRPSWLATFWGGALFAFGMALARFLLLR